jgi:TRAP-type C4-dicarboxylate transport system permease small subunit
MKFNPIVRLSDLSVVVSTIFLFAMMVHVSLDVLLKYVVNKPIPGTLEIVSAYYMVAGVFLPIAMVEIMRASIVVDVAYQFMPHAMKAFCIFLALFASALVYFILGWTTWGDALRSLSINEKMMGTVMVSVWPSRFILPFSFLFAGLVCVWHMYRFATSAVVREDMINAKEPEEEV